MNEHIDPIEDLVGDLFVDRQYELNLFWLYRLTTVPNLQSPISNPQSPITNPQSPIPNPQSPITKI